MRRKILGLLFAFCLIVPCGVLLTACCGGGTFFSLATYAQNATITLQTDETKKGDTVTFDVVADEPTEDYVYELERVYYVVEDSEQENVLTSQTSTYSFEMPEGNVTIYADVSQSEIYKDFSIFNGSLTSYYGNETDIVVPTSYSLYDTGNNERTIKLDSQQELLTFSQGKNYLTYVSGQYYVTPTIGDETLEETFVSASQVETYFENLIQTANSSNLSVEIKLTSYDVNVGDVTTEAHLGAYMRPFIEVSQGYLSSFIMEIEGQEEAITVTQENFDEQMSVIENIFSDGLDEGTQMSFTYGNYCLITEGDDFEITSIDINSISTETAFSDSAIESIVIPSTITNIANRTFENCTNLTSVTVESATVYNSLTNLSACGNLIEKATTIKVLKTIVDDTTNANEFLKTTGGYTKTEDGNYYIYSK